MATKTDNKKPVSTKAVKAAAPAAEKKAVEKKATVASTKAVKAVSNKDVASKATASSYSIRTSPRKLNLVAQTIRGLNVSKAIAELSFSKKRMAKTVLSVLQSAIANAENNHSLNIDKLYVSEAYVGKGMVMKRMHARGRGRGARVLKPFSHLTVVVAESVKE